MMPLPTEYKLSVCEVKSLENELLATGEISDVAQDYLQIGEKGHALPVLQYGAMVKVNIFNSSHGFRVLVGKVYLSSRKFIRLVEVSSLLDYERRNFFRVATSMKSTVRSVPSAESVEKGNPEESEIHIKNISLGGVLFISKAQFQIDDLVSVYLKVNHPDKWLNCIVRRADEAEGGQFWCGCEFTNPTESQTNAICSYIFQIQREQISGVR